MNLTRTQFGVAVDLPDGRLLPIRHVMGIGMNYAAHAHEQGKGVPERPVLFTKNPASVCLHRDDIIIPAACIEPSQVDFEAELGVIIDTRPDGSFVKDVSVELALSCVLGYVCVNDVSARWWQREGSGGQFCRGKSFDTFCPVGPAVVGAGTIGNPQNLRLRSRVNGEVMQDSNTSDMIFSVATLISELSRGTTLLPGTLMLTGTPSGVGFARKPPVYLRQGDVVEVEIERIGVLKNIVREER